jgi:hypothetical protein
MYLVIVIEGYVRLRGNSLSLNYSYLQWKSHVEGASNFMIHNIYRPQGTSSFISIFSHDAYCYYFFLTAPDTSNVLSLIHCMLLDTFVDHILLGDIC